VIDAGQQLAQLLEELRSGADVSPERMKKAAAAVVRATRANRRWRQREARNKALRAALAICERERPGDGIAWLAMKLRRFESDTLPRWAALKSPPENAQPLQCNLFAAFKSGAPVVQSIKRLEEILDKKKRCSRPASLAHPVGSEPGVKL